MGCTGSKTPAGAAEEKPAKRVDNSDQAEECGKPDEVFVPEEEEAGAEQHALGTQGDGLMSAKFRRAGASTSPKRAGADDEGGSKFTTEADESDPAPRRPPAKSQQESPRF